MEFSVSGEVLAYRTMPTRNPPLMMAPTQPKKADAGNGITVIRNWMAGLPRRVS
jgi:hypothetical protein